MNKPRNWNKKNIKNYVEIYIKSDVKKIVSRNKKKKVYKSKGNIVGLNIEPQFPLNPDIIIENSFDRNISKLVLELKKKIKKNLK
jgi:adenylylsulfate kinase